MSARLGDMPTVESHSPAHQLMVRRRHTQEPVPHLLDPRLACNPKRGISLLLSPPLRSELGDMIANLLGRSLAAVVPAGQLVGLQRDAVALVRDRMMHRPRSYPAGQRRSTRWERRACRRPPARITVRSCRSLVCPRVKTNLHRPAVIHGRLTCCFIQCDLHIRRRGVLQVGPPPCGSPEIIGPSPELRAAEKSPPG
jgi:hypothetical protein